MKELRIVSSFIYTHFVSLLSHTRELRPDGSQKTKPKWIVAYHSNISYLRNKKFYDRNYHNNKLNFNISPKNLSSY